LKVLYNFSFFEFCAQPNVQSVFIRPSPNETISPSSAIVPKQSAALLGVTKKGRDHVATHFKRHLSAVSSGHLTRHFKPEGKAMIEIGIALAAFFSTSIFLAHAFDVYRSH
jgi:hypothetical protein